MKFSHGPRNCPGKSLAYMEIRLILARVLFEFDLQLQQESRDWLSRLKVFGRSQRWLLKLSLCEG
jgi:cytochrome P450